MTTSLYTTTAQTQSLPDLQQATRSSSSKTFYSTTNVFPFETLHVLKNASTVGKINMSSTRNDFFRKPRLLAKNHATCLEKIYELTKRMKFKFFQRFSGYQIKELMKVMDIVYKPAGEYLFYKGDPGENMYLIYMGQVDVIVGDDDEGVFPLGPGQSFGELSLQINHIDRTSSVRCRTECAFGVLSRRVFSLATTHEKMLDDSRVTALIRKVSPFSALRPQLITAVAQQMDPLRLGAAEIIPTEDFNELFVMPLTGNFEIRGTIILGARTQALFGGASNDRGGESVYRNVPLFHLAKGMYFNDDIFMDKHDNSIEATAKRASRDWGQDMVFLDFCCIAREDGQLLTVTRHTFEKILRLDRNFVTRLKLRRSMLNVQIKDQMTQIVSLLSKPDYFTKSSLYTKKILEIIKETAKHIEGDKTLRNFDEQISVEARFREDTRSRKEAIISKFESDSSMAQEHVARETGRRLLAKSH